MKKLIYILFLIPNIISSCRNREEGINGTWIEVDNFQNPSILEIGDFSYKDTVNNQTFEKIYYFNNDTFYSNGAVQIYKSIIKKNKNRLQIYDVGEDTAIQVFERNTYENIVEYFNHKKGASIDLPQLKNSFQSTRDNYLNTMYVDYINKKMVVYFNGELHEINDTSYLALRNRRRKDNCQLFIDKELKVELLNKIKTELRKGQLNAIGYVIFSKNDALTTIGFRLPPLGIIGDLPLPPPLPVGIGKKQENIVIQINVDFLFLNSRKVEPDDLKENLKKLIRLNNNSVLKVFFCEQLDFETYINYVVAMQQAYIDLRNEYSMSNYKQSDYLELEYEVVRTIRNKYPMKIQEINKEELLKYAL
ncbi:hypothetical protein DMA11_17180 [Marinilabiliaceae bacterium JC017]|nr:hypothetical protein DMA11_17180 [Marinilabiliaceae bacterium JC017]